jgi:hypothetical protein
MRIFENAVLFFLGTTSPGSLGIGMTTWLGLASDAPVGDARAHRPNVLVRGADDPRAEVSSGRDQ